MDNPLLAYDLDELRTRQSVKWRQYDPDVLPVWVAEMDTPLAPPIRSALLAAVERGDTGYATPGPLPEIFAAFAARRYRWNPDPARMLLVPDVMRGISEALHVVTAPGDPIVMNVPAYPPFFTHLGLLGRRIVESPLLSTVDGYRVDLDRLERDFAAGARAYLLCNPHNPTGLVYSRDELLAVAELAERYDVRVVADEIHAPLVYPGREHVPFESLPTSASARSLVAVSASKAWNLAGLKAALLVAGEDAVPDLRRVPAEVSLGAGLPGVLASQVAFTEGEPWLAALLAGLDENRRLLGELLSDGLPEVGYVPPAATYLAWLDCRQLGLGDDPAAGFLDRGRVALSSGPTFGAVGRGHVRLNFATSPDVLADAVRRMAKARPGGPVTS